VTKSGGYTNVVIVLNALDEYDSESETATMLGLLLLCSKGAEIDPAHSFDKPP
jgi:hypothetical protein